MENEVQELRSSLNSGSSLTDNGSNVEKEEYNRVKDRLADFELAYGKLVAARQALEAKCRYYKDLTRDWRVYIQARESKRGERHESRDRVQGVPGNTSITPGGHHDIPSGSAPSSFQGHILSPSRSPSTTFGLGPTSAYMEAETGLRTPTKLRSPSQSKSPKDNGAIPISDAPMQDIHLLPIGDRHTGSTDTSNDCERQVKAEHSVKDQEVSTSREIQTLMGREDHSDSPIIVSERSLKRKRAPPTMNNHIQGHQLDNKAPGSVFKPVHVKSEQGSSSPAALDFSIRFGGTNESLDLDDVGDRLLTPRKRRRLQLQRRRSSMLKASAATETGETLLDYELDDADPEVDNAGLDRIFEGKEDPTSEQSLLYNEECYMRKREEYGKRLWEEEQRRSTEFHKQNELDARVPEWLRGSKNRIRAQQFLQNERTGNRRARLEANQQITPTRIDSKVGVFQPSKLRVPITRQKTPIEEGDCELPPNVTREPLHEPEPQYASDNRRTETNTPAILRAKDPNHQILPRTSEHLANQKRRLPPSRRDHRVAAVPFLAEDGENVGAAKDARKTLKSPKDLNAKNIDTSGANDQTPKAPDAYHRLGDLLAKPLPENPLLLSEGLGSRLAKPWRTSRTPPARSLRSNDVGTPTNQRARSARTARTNSTGSKPTNNTKTKLSTTKPLPPHSPRPNSPPTTLLSDEPLRARPLRRLRAEDFKPNPTYNQGRDYAFSEVVRARDQRQCLPGCDKSHCCGGQLRKMVQIGGYTPGRNSMLGAPPSQEAADEDQRIMLDYLGTNASARLKRMGDDEKQELLLQAKTKLFADEYGRHRQAYGRAPTPPGFWRTDMPSTQEEEEDRRQAWCLERVKVEEMYREARKDGGAWRFRDE